MVRRHIEQFLERLAKVVSSHESFYAWDIWSEPHIVQWSWVDYIKDPWFCYCKNSQNRFISWLNEKYKTIDALNEAWYRTHKSWEEVVAPRYVSLSSFRDLLDWIEFNIEKIAQDLEWKTKLLRKGDKDHLISSHAAISSVYGIPGIGYGASDDWRLSEKVDVWGTSFYPKHTGSWMPLKAHHMGVALDASRSSCESRGKPFWIGELQTGHGVTGMRLGEPVDELDVERWAWLAVSRNAKGLNYYAWLPMSCGYEISGFGLANYDGSVNERALAAGKVARIITENMDIFINSKATPAQVAILYNIEAHKALACLRAESAEVIRKDIFGIYKSLMNLGLNVDFLHLTDFRGDLSRYKVIFLPFSIALDEKAAEAIDDYISHGGTVVADGRLAWMKADGTLCEKIPGLGLDKIFGCEELWMKEVKKQTTLEFNGLKLSTYRYISVYKTLGGKTIATCENNPVIVKNNHNSGTAFMIGTLIGAGYEETGNLNNLDLIKEIILESGVKQQYYVECKQGNLEDIEIRSSSSSENGLVYLFNHGNTESVFDASISHDVFGKSFKEAICLNLSKTLMFEDDGKSAILKNVSLNPGQTMVVLLK